MPVKGKDTVYHFGLIADNQYGVNDQGWCFQTLFLNETLSGVKNSIRYGASMWMGKYVPNKGKTWGQNIIAQFAQEPSKELDYNTTYNLYDDNSEPYPMSDNINKKTFS